MWCTITPLQIADRGLTKGSQVGRWYRNMPNQWPASHQARERQRLYSDQDVHPDIKHGVASCCQLRDSNTSLTGCDDA